MCVCVIVRCYHVCVFVSEEEENTRAVIHQIKYVRPSAAQMDL